MTPQPVVVETMNILATNRAAFIYFIERTKVPEKALLVSVDLTSLYTNIPQEEGIQTVFKAYASFYHNKIPIPRYY